MNRRQRLLALYDEFPFEHHPMWVAVLQGELSKDEVIRGEAQHWIRTRAGQVLRRDALNSAKGVSDKIFGQLLETFLEECTNQRGTSHLDLIERLVVQGGFSKAALENLVATPGNAAAIALYRDITTRGAGCHMLGAGTVEHFYSQLSPRIYDAYTTRYEMTEQQAETYKIHGPMDHEHAERAFSIIDEAACLHGWEVVETSVRDAFVATSLHYDGMMQAATGRSGYWDGRRK